MQNRRFARYHLAATLLAQDAEVEGDETLSRRLRAETRLRLMCMSDEELWELSKITASPPETPVDVVYREYKRRIELLKATANEWTQDLSLACCFQISVVCRDTCYS